MCTTLVQESEAAIVSYAASAKRHRPIESEYSEYIGMLQGYVRDERRNPRRANNIAIGEFCMLY